MAAGDIKARMTLPASLLPSPTPGEGGFLVTPPAFTGPVEPPTPFAPPVYVPTPRC